MALMFHVKHPSPPQPKFCYGYTMSTNEAELRASIAAIGPLVPVLVWHGVTIDGRRRQQICGELGVYCPERHVSTLEEACTALWTVHPARAIQVAREHCGGHTGLPPTVRELATLCNVSATLIALELQKAQPKRREGKRSPRRTHSIKTEMVKFWAEPQWKHFVREVGAAKGMDLSQTIRVACWEYVQKHLPRAATEGSRRGPSVEHVRAPKKKTPA